MHPGRYLDLLLPWPSPLAAPATPMHGVQQHSCNPTIGKVFSLADVTLAPESSQNSLEGASDGTQTPTLPIIEDQTVAPVTTEVRPQYSSRSYHRSSGSAMAASMRCIPQSSDIPLNSKIISPCGATLAPAQKSIDMEPSYKRTTQCHGKSRPPPSSLPKKPRKIAKLGKLLKQKRLESVAPRTPNVLNIEESMTESISSEFPVGSSLHSIPNCSTEYLETVKAGVDCLASTASLQCILHPRCNRMSCRVFPFCDNTITQTQNCKMESPNERATLLPERITSANMECLQHLIFNPTTGLIRPFSKTILTRAKKCSTFWKTSCWPEDVTLAEQFEKALDQGSEQVGFHVRCYNLFTMKDRIQRATQAATDEWPSKCIFCNNRMKGKLLQCNTPELAARIIAGVAERKDQRLLDLIINEDIVARRQAYHVKCYQWYLYNAPHVTQVRLPATVEAAFRDYVANGISTVEVDGSTCVPVTALGTLFVKTVADVGAYSGYDGKGGYLMANLRKYCPYPLCADGKIETKLQPESCVNGHGQEGRTVWKHNGYAVDIRDSLTNLAGDCCIAPAQKSSNALSAQDWATLQRIKVRRQPSHMPKKSRSAAKLHKLMKQRRLERLASAGDAARKPTLPSIEELPVAPIISDAVKAPAAPVHCVLHRFCNPTDDTIIPPSDVTLVLAQKSKNNESAQERLAMASEAARTPTLPNIEELATAPITGEVHAKRSSYSIHSCSTEYLEAIKAPMTVPTKCLKHRICNSMSGKIIPFSDVTLTLAQKCSAFWKASCWPTDIAVAERFEKVLEQGREQLGYHSSCFRHFTGNYRLQLASLRAAEVFLDKCVFCFNLTSYCEKLWRCSTPELAARIMAAVAERKDKHLLNLIIGEDIVRRGLVYHVSCYTRYSYNDAHATQVRLPATVEAAFKDYMAKEITTLKVKNEICVPVTALGALFVKTVADAGAYDGYDDKGGYLMANLAKYCPYPLCAGGIIGPKVLPMSHVIEQDEDLEEDDAVWENNGEAVDFHDSVIDFVVEEDMDCLESCHDHASMYKNNQQKD